MEGTTPQRPERRTGAGGTPGGRTLAPEIILAEEGNTAVATAIYEGAKSAATLGDGRLPPRRKKGKRCSSNGAPNPGAD